MNANNEKFSRRRFLGALAAGSAGIAAMPHFLSAAKTVKLSAIDQVPLGKSGVRFSRLGFGTGSMGGRVQRELGQAKFTALVRHALDRGITYFDTADNYREMHEMLREALKGVDREKIQIQCKIWPGRHEETLKEIDRFRKEVGTDYFDSLLIHCVQTPGWAEEFKHLRDVLDEAREKKIIRARGVSVHGLPGLKAVTESSWGDVRLVRVNHNGTHMDGPTGKWAEPGQVKPVINYVKKMHAAGKGIIAMKLIGNGDFVNAQTREQSIRFVMGLECVDAAVIGFKSPKEIDEAIRQINRALEVRTVKTAKAV